MIYKSNADGFLRQALPRLIADMAVVHLSALASLAAVVLWQRSEVSQQDAAALIAALRQYYQQTFFPLSWVFPMVFALHGFYTRSRTYSGTYKWITLAKGATIASLVFLFASFLLSRADTVPRSAILAFIPLVNTMLIGIRVTKAWLMDRRPVSTTASIEERPRPVLVVGGGGYIGSIICRKLLAQGQRVRLLDSFVYGQDAVKELFAHPNFEVIQGDCRNIQSVVSAMQGVTSVIHLAAIVGDPACEQDRPSALEINFAATRMMIEVAKGYGVERFIFASSCSVYGENEELVDEHSDTGPISLYAQTKVDSERVLLAARTPSFHPVILRLATVFGNSYRPRFDLVVNLLTAKALREGVITIYNGEQWRPFIHVSDVAEGFVTMLNAPLQTVSGQIYNLGDSRLNFTLTQVAEAIRTLIPGTRIEHVENPDRRNYRVCFDKIRSELGFECEVGLQEGVADLKIALQTGKIPDYLDPLYHNQRFLKASGPLTSPAEIDAQVMAAFAMALSDVQAVGVGDAPRV
jgi:nucleoside-diphosphate-sugar epimerase